MWKMQLQIPIYLLFILCYLQNDTRQAKRPCDFHVVEHMFASKESGKEGNWPSTRKFGNGFPTFLELKIVQYIQTKGGKESTQSPLRVHQTS